MYSPIDMYDGPGEALLCRAQTGAPRPSEAVEPQHDDSTVNNISYRGPVGKRLGEPRAIYFKRAESKTGY